MRYLHQKLKTKLNFYHIWHQHKHHNKIHWGVFLTYALFLFALLLAPMGVVLIDSKILDVPNLQIARATTPSTDTTFQEWTKSGIISE